jgi:hypothetical protein
MIRLPFLALGVACCALSAVAQNRSAVAQSRVAIGVAPSSRAPVHAPFEAGARHSTVIVGGEPFRHHPRGFLPYYYGLPYWGYYEPYDVEYPPKEEPAPQPAAPVAAKPEPLPDPVLLELEGNRWVRVTSFGESQQAAGGVAAGREREAKVEPLPPAVLVYRDGHSEQVSSYLIVGRALYTKADYWATGSWTRTIQIADLDIPATLERNHQRGLQFELPSSPDEIVIRP